MFRRKRSQQDFADEIRAHLELEADALKDEGRSEEQAHTEARRAFGNTTTARERFNLHGRWLWTDSLWSDLRFALRGLKAKPGFALTAILTLALGVGANTAVFSVMNAVLLRSLPVTDPERVVYLHTSGPPQRTGTIDSHDTFSYPVYDALRRQNGPLSEVIAVGALSTDKVNVRLGADPELAEGDMVSANFFRGLGVRLTRGRGFLDTEETTHAPVMVLSYNYWTRRLARDPGVLGKTIYVKGVPFSVVGVAAEGFEGTEAGQSIDFWIPLQNRVELNVLGNPPENGKLYQQDSTWWCLRLLGRLRPGVSREQAASQLQPLFQAAAYVGLGTPLAGEKPPVLRLSEAKNFPGYDDQYGKPLKLLMAMVALVLLIALTNVVMLLLARNAARRREFSLRLALGARQRELLQQLLTESLLLVAAGGILAWVFAGFATRYLGQWAQIEASLAPDTTVLLFTLGVLVVAALLFGVAPLGVALSGGAELALKGSAATSGKDAAGSRAAKSMVALQMALCMVLLVGGGLLWRTLENLRHISLGFDTAGLVVFGLDPQGLHSEGELVRFYQELERQLRVLPGVESVTVMQSRLGSWWSNNGEATIDGHAPDTRNGASAMMRNNDIGPDFFHTLGVPVVLGREFTDADNATSQKVAVVNELFVERFLPGQSPLGHQVNGMTIIGVVKNHKYRSMDEQPVPMAWWSYAQAPAEGGMTVEMRVRGDALSILPSVRKIVARMDPDAPLIKPILQREQFESTISGQLMFARLAECFALMAVVLVATGLYGTLAYRVSRRTAEIGVRMAVGARRGQVVWMVLRSSLTLTAAGMLTGIPLALAVGYALSGFLYGVKPFDLESYGFAAVGLTTVALLAGAIPAARAASINPVGALRAE
jgi:predicted permease